MAQQEKIDFIIPWVDGSDPAWIEQKNQYSGIAVEQGVNNARFRDWGTLKYALRSIEKYAGWVHKVYLLTWGHIPDWLNTSCEKLEVIRHDEFIPKKYLPTFSSHVIELNMHRIPGLSEEFVYFNDDMLFVNPVKPDFFFKDGKPAGIGALHIHCVDKKNMIYTICNNNTELINDHFDLRETLRLRTNWFNLKYGLKNLAETTVLSACPRFPGIKNTHLPNAYLKSTLNEVWEKEYAILDETCTHKFREKTDVNQWLFLNWQLASNNFYPVQAKNRGSLVDFEKDGDTEEVLKKARHVLLESKDKMICINDGDQVADYEKLSQQVKDLLEQKYPDKSCFEK